METKAGKFEVAKTKRREEERGIEKEMRREGVKKKKRRRQNKKRKNDRDKESGRRIGDLG